MPKLRNGSTDIEKFTQWIGRKCRNHNPLAEITKSQAVRSKLASTYKESTAAEVGVVPQGDRSQLIYRVGGKCFHIEVRELPVEEFEGVELDPIGF